MDQPLSNIYRLTYDNPTTAASFASHAALGKVPPRGLSDLCAWASCSFTSDPAMLKKLKKLKHPYAARLDLAAGEGMSLKKGIHVDFWRARGVLLENLVVQVEEI